MRYRFVVLTLVLAAACVAQEKRPGATASPKDKLAWEWNDTARKLNAIAANFPENKYDFKATPEVRTFAQQLLHLAFWNQWVAQRAQGKKPDEKPNELPRSQYKTKAQVTAVLKESFEEAVAALRAQSDDQVMQSLVMWTEFLEHTGEHYGQLVMYYRLSGLVPPESRQQ